jgi:hypothetical protein
MTIKRMSLWFVLSLGVLLSSAGFTCGGGTQTTPLGASPRAPAAEGEVEARRIENANTRLVVKVRHLAHPEKIQAGATTYVVWLQPSGQDRPQNIGALQVDQNLTGTLTATTPHDQFQITITAEPFPQASAPAGVEVFKATVRAR